MVYQPLLGAGGHSRRSLASPLRLDPLIRAPWRSGYAAACKAVYTGSIPVGASVPTTEKGPSRGPPFRRPCHQVDQFAGSSVLKLRKSSTRSLLRLRSINTAFAEKLHGLHRPVERRA